MLRFKLTTIVAVAGVWLATGWPARAEDLRKEVHIATEGAFAPWNFTRPDGSVDGYEVDLAKDFCARAKLKCTVTAEGFDGLIPSLTGGKIDAIMAAMSMTPKRQEIIAFSRIYGVTEQGFATLKGSPLADIPDLGKVFSFDKDEASTLAEIAKLAPVLKGKVIGVQGGAIADKFITKYFGDTVQLRQYKTTEQHDLDLMSGRIDAAFTSTVYLTTALKKPGNEEMMMVGPKFRGGLLGAGVGVGLRKSDAALKTAFDEAVKSAQEDGTLTKLSMKWFGMDVSPH